MKVKAIINFNDLEKDVHRNVGDVFEVSQERADFLLEHNAIEIVVEEPINVVINAEEVKNKVVKPKKKNKKK